MFVFFVPFVVFDFVPNVCFLCPVCEFLSRRQVAYLSRFRFFVPLRFFCPAAGLRVQEFKVFRCRLGSDFVFVIFSLFISFFFVFLWFEACSKMSGFTPY